MSITLWKNFFKEQIEQFYNEAISITDFFSKMGYSRPPQGKSRTDFEKTYSYLPLDKIKHSQIKDLTGQTFGFLKVISQDTKKTKERKRVYWKCICQRCGKEVSIRGCNLISGNSQSCGCDRGRNLRDDLTGQTFGYLKVLSLDIEKSIEKKSNMYKCLCTNCNSIKSYYAENLRKGLTKSCGCMKGEVISEKLRDDLTNQTFGYLFVKSYNQEKSKEHGKVYWNCYCTNCGSMTVAASQNLKEGKTWCCGCLRKNSYGEELITKILEEIGINFEVQKSFPKLIGKKNPLKFDFYLPDLNTCIEYQGIQHYKSVDAFGGEEKFKIQQNYDNIKRQYCLEKSICLIEIPYTEEHLLSKDYILEKLQERGIKYEEND